MSNHKQAIISMLKRAPNQELPAEVVLAAVGNISEVKMVILNLIHEGVVEWGMHSMLKFKERRQ